MRWSVGDKMKSCISGVCKTSFCRAYRVSSSHVDNIVKELKGGPSTTAKAFTDHSSVDLLVLPDLRRIAAGFGLHLTKTQVTAS